MDISRRGFVFSAAAAPLTFGPRGGIFTELHESRLAFAQACGAGSLCCLRSASIIETGPQSTNWLARQGIRAGRPLLITGPAWIHYHWPVGVLIRTFGPVTPLRGGEPIAHLGNVPVAVRRDGIIALGSPLGPHVYAGDHDAIRLLHALAQHFT